jgi:hypothetical protein
VSHGDRHLRSQVGRESVAVLDQVRGGCHTSVKLREYWRRHFKTCREKYSFGRTLRANVWSTATSGIAIELSGRNNAP